LSLPRFEPKSLGWMIDSAMALLEDLLFE
jgi:hypothetical protein